MRLIKYSVLICGLLSTISLYAKPQVTWTRWNDPPIFIEDLPFRGEGLLGKMEEEIKKELPEYEHSLIWVNFPRVLQSAKEKRETCNAGWLDTPEWRKVFYLSKPSFIIPANGVLIKKKNLHLVRDLGPYSLRRLLSAKYLRMAIGRLYGEGVDDYLKKVNYQNHPQIDVVKNSATAHKMLQMDRVNYTIGYPFEAYYYQQIMKTQDAFKGKVQDQIIHLPLEENANYVEVVFACAKTPQGKKVIDRINKLLTDKKRLKRFEGYLDRWLSVDEIKKLELPRKYFYKKYYPQFTKGS